MAENRELNLVVNVQGGESVQNLKTQIREAKREIEQFEEGSEGFIKASQNVAKLSDKLDDVNDQVKLLKGDALERVAGGFKGIGGAILDLDVGKLAMANQSLKSIPFKDLIGNAKGFGKELLTLATNPLFLIPAAIGLIISNFDKLIKIFPGLGTIVDGVKIVFEKLVGFIVDGINYAGQLYEKFKPIINILFPITGLIEVIIDLLGEQADKQAEIDRINAKREENAKKYVENEKGRRDEVKNKYDREIALARSLGKETDELEVKSLKAQKAVIDNQIERIKAFQQTTSLFDNVLGPILDKLKKDQEDAALQIQIKQNEINTEKNNKRKEEQDKEVESEKQHQKDLSNLYSDALDDFEKMVEKSKEEEKKSKEEEKLKREAEDKAIIEESKASTRKKLQAQIDVTKEIQQERMGEVSSIDLELEQLEFEGQLTIDKQIELENRKFELLKEIAITNGEETAQIELQQQQRIEQIREAGRNKAIQQAQAIGTALISIGTSLSSFSKKSEKEKIKNERNATLASIALSTGIGIAQAVSDGMKTGVTPIEKGVAIASGIALVLANIAKARQTVKQADDAIRKLGESTPPPPDLNVSGGGGGGGGGSNGGPITPPTFNLGGQQIGGASNMLGSNNVVNGQQPIKVFVSETDISNVSKKVKVTEGNSLFGG